MNILVSGASGYIGSQLVPELLRAGHYVVCMGRNARQLTRKFPRYVHVVEADALRPEKLDGIFRGIDVAYYLIHSLGAGEHRFRQTDQTAARNFATAAKAAGVKRIVYLGGLGDHNSELSAHLRSRQETSRTLRQYGPPLSRKVHTVHKSMYHTISNMDGCLGVSWVFEIRASADRGTKSRQVTSLKIVTVK